MAGKSAKHIAFVDADNTDSPIMFPVGVRNVAWIGRAGEPHDIESHRALVRLNHQGEPRVLNVVTDGYKLVHNRDLFSRVNSTLKELVPPAALEGAYCEDSTAFYGRTCVRSYVFPALKCKVHDDVSSISFRLIVQNGYGGSALRMHSGAIDFFCTNGMIRGDYETMYRRHTSGLVIDHITDALSSSLDNYTSASRQWLEWSQRAAQREATIAMFRSFTTSDRVYEGLVDQWMVEREQRGNTMWSAYNALTYYASHVEDGVFAMRAGNAENMTATQLNRELQVTRFVASPAWKAYEAA